MYRRASLQRPIASTFVVAVAFAMIGISSFASTALFASSVGTSSNSLGALKVDPPAGQSAPTPVASGVVDLSWSATPTSPGTHTLTYLVLRRVSGVDPYVQVAETAATTYSDTPPADGLYDYKIQAKIASGTGYFSSGDSAVQTGRSDRTAPVATVTSPSASDVTQLTVSVSYSDGGTGVTSVALWVKPVGAPSYSLVSTQSFAASASGTRTFSYTASAGVGSYLFYSIATDAAGNVEAIPGAAELTTVFDPTLEFKRPPSYNNPPDLDMNPNYAPSGADTTCTLGAGGCTWTAPAYSAGQGFSGPSSTTTVYLENTAYTPPTLRGVTAQYTGNSTSTYCGYNSPYWAGDVVICAVSYGGGSGETITDPFSPWVRIKRTDAGTSVGTVWYYNVLTTGCNGACSGGGAFPVGISPKARFTSVSLLYTGVGTTGSPIVANDGLGEAACCATLHDAPSIDTGTVTNAMIVTAHAHGSGWAATTWTPPSGGYGTMIERLEQQAPSSGALIQVSSEINDLVQSGAGWTGTRTATSSTSGIVASNILALRPLPATCTVTVALLKNGVSFASNTAGITTGSVVSTPVAITHGAVSFAAGDKLSVKVTQPVSASCAVKVHYDGGSAVSKLVHPQ